VGVPGRGEMSVLRKGKLLKKKKDLISFNTIERTQHLGSTAGKFRQKKMRNTNCRKKRIAKRAYKKRRRRSEPRLLKASDSAGDGKERAGHQKVRTLDVPSQGS